MSFEKFIASESDNYYVPFLDLMSGIVFILMIILSTELLNIKYSDTNVSSQTSSNSDSSQIHYENLNPLELFKKNLVSSISTDLNNKNIKNSISRNYSSIIISTAPLFHKKSVSLTNNGQKVALGLSEAFDANVFLKVATNEQFKKNINYIKSIAINVYPYRSEDIESSMISRSFVFYGHLVEMNPSILLFSNNYYPRLIRISETTVLPQTVNSMEMEKKDIIILNFDFCYPQQEALAW